jgi:hypothetical protein
MRRPGSRAPHRAPGHAHILLARTLITAGNHIDHALTAHQSGAEASGEDPPDQRGLPCWSLRRCRRQPTVTPAGGEHVTGAPNDLPPHRYRIRVRSRLGQTIRSAFPALQARASGADTVLTGPLCDRTGCSRRSRRSASSYSRSAACRRRDAPPPPAAGYPFSAIAARLGASRGFPHCTHASWHLTPGELTHINDADSAS